MTREEAVIILDGFKNNPLFSDTHTQALDMAISALSENKGEWIERRNKATGHIESVCSVCGAEESYPYNLFCPNCGADMREPIGEKGIE